MVKNKRHLTAILLLALIIFMISADNKEGFYLKNQNLYYNNKMILSNVVDYKLTKLNEKNLNLIVLECIDKDVYVDGILIGDWVRFYDIEEIDKTITLELIYENDFTKVSPWAIDAGDLDGDDYKEIYVGAYRATDYYEIAKRPFFFYWNGEILTRLWTGSYMSTDKLIEISFEDFDNDNYDEVKTLEELPNGDLAIRYYRWGYFSFNRVK